ncbi:MAG: hypothetical protein FJ100_21830 [Deltaproteobacteria bacterium]|nr:hypothetical protein [Deltaproteobacteria bacterium]
MFAITACPMARAAPLSPTVQAVVTTAEKAFGAGQYDRASELFEQAYKAAATETTLLYNAARAAQMAKQWDRSEALYVQYQALPNRDPKYVDKATQYLPDVRAARQAQRVDEAKAKAKDGDQYQKEKRYREASAAYRDAWRLIPEQLEYLFRAGAAAALGCDEAVARQYLTDYLQKAATDAPDRIEAQARLDGIAKTCKDGHPISQSEVVVRKVDETVVRRTGDTASDGTGSIGLWVAVGGGVAALAGGVIYGIGAANRADFEASTKKDANGLIGNGWTVETAKARATEIGNQQTLGAVVAGVGVAAGVAGGVLWWLGKGDSKVAVAPTPAGAVLAWRF